METNQLSESSMRRRAKPQQTHRRRWEKPYCSDYIRFGVEGAMMMNVLVLQREEESFPVMLGEVASSYTFGRLWRSLRKVS